MAPISAQQAGIPSRGFQRPLKAPIPWSHSHTLGVKQSDTRQCPLQSKHIFSEKSGGQRSPSCGLSKMSSTQACGDRLAAVVIMAATSPDSMIREGSIWKPSQEAVSVAPG